MLDTNTVYQFCASVKAPDGKTDINMRNVIFFSKLVHCDERSKQNT